MGSDTLCRPFQGLARYRVYPWGVAPGFIMRAFQARSWSLALTR
jgi:hypothetical protein